jgi:PhnB protein
MLKASLYLNFPGTTEEAFEFYRSVFGGTFSPINRFSEGGMGDVGEIFKDKVMHMSLPITENLVLHGTDVVEGMNDVLVLGNQTSIMLEVSEKTEADRFYKALSVGGKDEMPMQDTFWGAYFGSFTDRFGVQWMIDCEQTPQK